MLNFNGYAESGALSGSSPTQFYMTSNSAMERRLSELDKETRREVRKHMDEFHSEEEMDMFIKQMTKGGRSIT